MLIKAGVDISRLNREIRRTLPIVNEYFLLRAHEIVITSTYEGNHSAGSLHYSNDAYDIRCPKSPPSISVGEIKELLGKDFDVVDEVDHIHIEYDPKT